jgi:hypothetical protein
MSFPLKGLRQMSQKLLEDYLDVEPFAAQVERDPRTVYRWMKAPNGLPYTQIGNRTLIHIPTARDWLQSKMVNPNPLKSKHSRSRAR